MSKRKRNHGEAFVWVSFSDLLTVLLLGFIVIAVIAMADTKTAKAETEQLKKDINPEEIAKGRECREERKLHEETKGALAEKLLAVSVDLKRKMDDLKSQTLICHQANIELTDSKDGVILYLKEGAPQSEWFTDGQATLGPKAQECIYRFSELWIEQIKSQGLFEFVNQLVIEGHSNSTPYANEPNQERNFLKNLELSQDRALAAATYILEFGKKDVDWRRERVTAVGKSFLEPVKTVDGLEDKVKSKRLVFKVKLKEQSTAHASI